MVFDPRHPDYQTSDGNSAETLRCNLLNKCRDVNPALLTILLPSTAKITHEHTYAKQSDILTSEGENNETIAMPQESNDTMQEEIQHYFVKCYEDALISKILNSLQVTSEQRVALEEQTRGQSDSCLWRYARAYRITGSKCGWILLQKDKTEALLQFVLYPKPFNVIPKPMEWGKLNENQARDTYVEYMRSHGHPRITADICGLFVHKEKRWLGASPDACVYDPDDHYPYGIAEIKCPFSKANDTIEEACEDTM